MMSRVSFALVLGFVAASHFACSGDATSSTTGTGSGGGNATVSTTSASGGSGGGGPCTTVDGCGDDEYCDFPDDMCGAGEPGVCTPRSFGCSDGALVVCGCDGNVHYAGCQTAQGFDTNVDASSCDPTTFSGTGESVFVCGDKFCKTGITYCQRQVSDIGGEPDTYECELLPMGCSDGVATADCACLSGESCGDMCSEAGSQELTLTCPGG